MKDMHAQYRTSVLGHFGLRIVAGAILWQHGAQKLFGAFGGMDGAGHAAPRDFSLLGIAGPLEFLGGILIILGLFARPVAFILAGEMAVIYFLMHFPHGFWPIMNHGDVPVILCFVFLYLAATGGGIYSLDHVRNRKRPNSVMG